MIERNSDAKIFIKVFEHLYTSPKLVLRCISTWLKKGGYLIIQTPNAVSLGKRVSILRGLNPFEMIRETRTNPGHFREYTLEELVSIGKELGFIIINYSIQNYFGKISHIKSIKEIIKINIKNIIYNIYPETRERITICLQKV